MSDASNVGSATGLRIQPLTGHEQDRLSADERPDAIAYCWWDDSHFIWCWEVSPPWRSSHPWDKGQARRRERAIKQMTRALRKRLAVIARSKDEGEDLRLGGWAS